MANETRQTLKDFLRDPDGDYGVADADSISLSHVYDANLTGKVDEGDDLGSTSVGSTDNHLLLGPLSGDFAEVTGLLGDYLNYITTHFHRSGEDGTDSNKYFIEKKNVKAKGINRGNSIPPPSDMQGADNTFSEDIGLSDTLSSYSNSKLFDNAHASKDVSELVNKTAAEGSVAPIGHHIFTDVNENQVDSDVVQSSFAVLKANNRFSNSPSDRYSYENNISGNQSFASTQVEPGEYKKFGEPGLMDFSFGALGKIGHNILKEASGLNNAGIPSATDVSAKSVPLSPFRDMIVGDDVREDTGAFEEAQGKEIKKSFTSPDNKFTDKEQNIEDIAHDDKTYFEGIIDEFLDLLDSGNNDTRKNNSVYTVHDYKSSISKALEVYFNPEGEFFNDPFFANMANVLTKIINEEKLENTPGNERITSNPELEAAKKFIDTMAVLGDAMLELGASGDKKPGGGGKKLSGGIWDVDALKEGPATRISKSKSWNRGPNRNSLAWRGSSIPSIYHLPESVIRSMQNMGSVSGQNPMKGMLAGGLVDKTYMSQNMAEVLEVFDKLDTDKLGQGGAKIPKMLVERMENQLDAEYVPFYFHDLRTNEIISFHAFLSDLSDSFKADYESNDGFGRMDPVRIYKNTTRDIGFSFKVVATSEQDFDEMWFKINKLITLLYPQWSAGEEIAGSKSIFTRPFSQVPVASPMIRLRIGDVVKSNYSRFNLSRIFGSGHVNTIISPEDVAATSVLGMLSETLNIGMNDGLQEAQITASKFMLKVMLVGIGSPLQLVEMIPDDSIGGLIIKNVAFDFLSQFLENGFVNPTLGFAIDRLRDPDGDKQTLAWAAGKGVGPRVGDAVMLVPSQEKYYLSPKDGVNVPDLVAFMNIFHGLDSKNTKFARNEKDQFDESIMKIRTTRHVKCRVIGRESITLDDGRQKTYFNVVAVAGTGLTAWRGVTMKNVENSLKFQQEKLEGRVFTVTNDDLILDPDYLFDAFLGPLLDPISGLIDKVQDMIDMFAGSLGVSTDNINLFTTTFEDFMHPVNNSITRAFETTSGRGLAGFISSLSFDWIDGDNTPWETEFGSRAPKICNIKVKFEPVHDIAPGLDSAGFNRAPTHNVGSIMNNISGDPYEKGFETSKRSFDKAGSTGSTKRKA